MHGKYITDTLYLQKRERRESSRKHERMDEKETTDQRHSVYAVAGYIGQYSRDDICTGSR